MAVVRVKDGVEFTVIAPGGFRILGALDLVAEAGEQDLWITSACDGAHSGPDDPHHRGEAYDVRSHDHPDAGLLLQDIEQMLNLAQFFAFIEDEGTPNAHIHIQVRKGTTYP